MKYFYKTLTEQFNMSQYYCLTYLEELYVGFGKKAAENKFPLENSVWLGKPKRELGASE